MGLETPVGVLEEEGVLNHPMQHLTVHCLPGDIPEKVTVDVSGLRVGDSIHVKDLNVPNVTFRDSPEEVVASVTHSTRVEEVVAPAEGEEGAEGAEGAEGVEGAEGAAGAAGEGTAEGEGAADADTKGKGRKKESGENK